MRDLLIIGILLSAIILLALRVEESMSKLICLVVLFLLVSMTFLLLDWFFLGLTYIIVYIGAIAILFLFFLMTVTVHPSLPSSPGTLSKPLGLLGGLWILTGIGVWTLSEAGADELMSGLIEAAEPNWWSSINNISDINIFGHLLFQPEAFG